MTNATDSQSGTTHTTARFVSFVTGKPLVALLLGLASLFAIAVGLPRITANFTHTAFFKDGDPMLAQFDQFERQFGNDGGCMISRPP